LVTVVVVVVAPAAAGVVFSAAAARALEDATRFLAGGFWGTPPVIVSPPPLSWFSATTAILLLLEVVEVVAEEKEKRERVKERVREKGQVSRLKKKKRNSLSFDPSTARKIDDTTFFFCASIPLFFAFFGSLRLVFDIFWFLGSNLGQEEGSLKMATRANRCKRKKCKLSSLFFLFPLHASQ